MTDLVLRFLAGALIVALYGSNFVTGWTATQRARAYLPPAKERWRAAWWLIRSLVLPWRLEEPCAKANRVAIIRTVNCYGTYLSSFTAVGMALTHIVWLNSGAWREQEHIFPFALFHWLAAVVVHFLHVRLIAELSQKGGEHGV